MSKNREKNGPPEHASPSGKTDGTVLSHHIEKTQGVNSADLVSRFTRIGSALTAEKNIDRLLEMIVDEAKKLTHANGGTLYVISDDALTLQFAIVQNDTLQLRMGGTGTRIDWSPVPLRNPDESPNHQNVSAYAALTGKVINIENVYHATGFNFEGTRKFDKQTGYRSVSMLVVPLKNHDNDLIGVLQLINAQDPETGKIRAFTAWEQQITESLASQAAISLSNNTLIHNLETLLHAFIRSIATAIDEKSPYTGDHVRRVADLSLTIADRINAAREGPFAECFFTAAQIEELRIAAWLHDVGKIVTPEHIVNKSTKLEAVIDRIELIKTRLEILKRDHKINALEKRLTAFQVEGMTPPTGKEEEEGEENTDFDDLFSLIEKINLGLTDVNDHVLERLQGVSRRQWMDADGLRPLLTENELYNLSIRQGTLTDEERAIVESHAVITHDMLSQLPFPKKFQNVPFLAACHHERLDGTGYPQGLTDDQLPLQARILALADIFEALTATDRPYNRGSTLVDAIRIMKGMAADHHIDADLFAFFLREKIHLDYANRELAGWQCEEADL
ncbi:MAG: GAF domain-containing protein [Deltaproteobacteria bacterium]|nr:GAF domain-containing protein [Deltaproteobacteria bacterium]